MSYDEAGNQLSDASSHPLSYDAENHQKSFTSGAITYTYSYDGDGRRVKREYNDGTARTTVLVYNASGQLIAEYNSDPAPPVQGGGGVSYLTTDHLGSTRVVTNSTGGVKARHDYLPYGEDVGSSVGSRSTVGGYDLQDGVRQKFTQKERDTESGLDYFLARYYSSAQGRFTSPDPLLSSAAVVQPQSWNRYSYAFNSPLKYTDPLGLYVWSDALGGGATDEELLNKAGSDRDKRRDAQRIIDKRNRFRTSLAEAHRAAFNSDNPIAVLNAVASYGTEGAANGVTVTFGQTEDGATATTGANNGQTLAVGADGSLIASVLVTFKDNLRGNDLTESVAHEGQHVADRQNFALHANSYIQAGYSQDAVYNSRFNPTVRTIETRAYRGSSLIAQGLSLPNLEFGGHRVWDSGWRQADRATLRDRGINAFLTSSRAYRDRLNNRVFNK